MIAMLKGVVADRQTTGIVLDVGGVGYELAVPVSTLAALPETGKSATLYVQMLVREDAILLYGFLTREEKAAFQTLVKVSGIGAKTALAVLSSLSVADLAAAVAAGEADLLTRVPGIGKKTAARLVLELKGKLDGLAPGLPGSSAEGPAPGSVQADVAAGLIALGYSERDAAAAARRLPKGVSAAEGIRLALRSKV